MWHAVCNGTTDTDGTHPFFLCLKGALVLFPVLAIHWVCDVSRALQARCRKERQIPNQHVACYNAAGPDISFGGIHSEDLIIGGCSSQLLKPGPQHLRACKDDSVTYWGDANLVASCTQSAWSFMHTNMEARSATHRMDLCRQPVSSACLARQGELCQPKVNAGRYRAVHVFYGVDIPGGKNSAQPKSKILNIISGSTLQIMRLLLEMSRCATPATVCMYSWVCIST